MKICLSSNCMSPSISSFTFIKRLIHDYKANVTDIIRICAHIKGFRLLSGRMVERADINGDGVINVNDVIKISSFIKGIRSGE